MCWWWQGPCSKRDKNLTCKLYRKHDMENREICRCTHPKTPKRLQKKCHVQQSHGLPIALPTSITRPTYSDLWLKT